jgi:aspartate ammonia-lyase
VIQGGAGTSTNMNANEVVANRALELLGHRRGDVRRGAPEQPRQSLAVHQRRVPDGDPHCEQLGDRPLSGALAELRDALLAKGHEFADIVKIGRTQLQDAVPMTLGQEFQAWGVMIGEDVDRLREVAALLREINMGATAIGTGINTDPRYAESSGATSPT